MSGLMPDVLEMLVCPHCRAQLTWAYESFELICCNADCGRAYPVKDGIPILVEDAARRPER